MKLSCKGHTDRNRHKNRIKRSGPAWLVYVSDINQLRLPIPFYSVLVSSSVLMALLTVFHSLTSPDNSTLSRAFLPVLFLPYWSFPLYVSLWKSPPALI